MFPSRPNTHRLHYAIPFLSPGPQIYAGLATYCYDTPISTLHSKYFVSCLLENATIRKKTPFKKNILSLSSVFTAHQPFLFPSNFQHQLIALFLSYEHNTTHLLKRIETQFADRLLFFVVQCSAYQANCSVSFSAIVLLCDATTRHP